MTIARDYIEILSDITDTAYSDTASNIIRKTSTAKFVKACRDMDNG